MFKNASPVMQRIYQEAARIAESFLTVLITGPTGAGKEVIANFIHQSRPVPNTPFIAVNCGAIPENLMESQLFGHEKGAFTGAAGRYNGYFGLAENGTLFLDEIGELPLYQQAKLLRVLETRSYWPVGAATERPFLGRIIAATNVNLEEMVRQKAFREDLFYRLSVFCIEVPGLDRRREDIAELASHFARSRPCPLELTPEALQVLSRTEWPGNVRQLRHTIERVAILSHETRITAEIIQEFLPDAKPDTPTLLDSIADALLYLDIDNKLSAIEYAMLTRAIKASDGNKSEAARMLGVHRKRIERGLNALESDIREIQELCNAADRDLARSAFQSALNRYEKAGKLLERHPYGRKMEELQLEILVKQGICQRSVSGWNDSGLGIVYEKAKALGKRLNRMDRLTAVMFGSWAMDLMKLDLEKARQTAGEYLEEGRRFGDRFLLPQAYIAIANTLFWMGEHDKADAALGKFIDHYRYDEILMIEAGHDPFIFYLLLFSLISFQKGHLRQARESLDRLICYSERISHPFCRAVSLHAGSWVEYLFGDLDSANGYAEKLVRLCECDSFPFYEGLGMIFNGVWLAAHGRLEQGAALIRKGFHEKMGKDGGRLFNSMYGICIADAYCRNARWEEAMDHLEPTIELSRRKGELCYLGDQLRFRGRIHLALKNFEAAEKDFRTGMLVAEHQGAKTAELRSRRRLYRLLLDTGREKEAVALVRSPADEPGEEPEWSLLCGEDDLEWEDRTIDKSRRKRRKS